MILLCGIPSEPPLAAVRNELDKLQIEHAVYNQRRFEEVEIRLDVSGVSLGGYMSLEGRKLALEEMSGVYLRLMDDQSLPELEGEPRDSEKRLLSTAIHDVLMRWCEITRARVVNRPAAMGSNNSKPYQLQLIRNEKFQIPETLVANDPGLVREFLGKHKKLVYKSASGERSIVQLLAEEDLPRLDRIRWCPTLFQQYIEGMDLRVHVVGNEVFATRVDSGAIDYRYAHRQGYKDAKLTPYDISDGLDERCINLSRALGLDFTGIDLKITPDGGVYCLEVNPSPAFSYYENHTGQPIARAIAKHLR